MTFVPAGAEPPPEHMENLNMPLKNRVAVISGATGVTGRLAARTFAEQGASLVLLSTDQHKLDLLVRDLDLSHERILSIAVDLNDREAAFEAAKAVNAKFGWADILLHLVGGWTGGKTVIETPVEELQNMLNQHLWTTFHLTQAFLPHLIRNGWGRVIIISSPVAVRPPAKLGAYAIGKAAEETLMLAISKEARENGVTANIIQVRSIDVKGEGKGTSPEEIMAAVLYLCSEDAAKINGVRVPLFGSAKYPV
jgi:NAD(P)-dependent dehydrogenase (short-subunit alcohol dehydrogenase family)